MGARGVKALSSRDWLFGSRPRRLALEALVAEPNRAWTKADLARAAGVSVHGGIDEHVAGFARVGLLVRDGASWRLAQPRGPVAGALEGLLDAIRPLPDDDAGGQSSEA